MILEYANPVQKYKKNWMKMLSFLIYSIFLLIYFPKLIISYGMFAILNLAPFW